MQRTECKGGKIYEINDVQVNAKGNFIHLPFISRTLTNARLPVSTEIAGRWISTNWANSILNAKFWVWLKWIFSKFLSLCSWLLPGPRCSLLHFIFLRGLKTWRKVHICLKALPFLWFFIYILIYLILIKIFIFWINSNINISAYFCQPFELILRESFLSQCASKSYGEKQASKPYILLHRFFANFFISIFIAFNSAEGNLCLLFTQMFKLQLFLPPTFTHVPMHPTPAGSNWPPFRPYVCSRKSQGKVAQA